MTVSAYWRFNLSGRNTPLYGACSGLRRRRAGAVLMLAVSATGGDRRGSQPANSRLTVGVAQGRVSSSRGCQSGSAERPLSRRPASCSRRGTFVSNTTATPADPAPRQRAAAEPPRWSWLRMSPVPSRPRPVQATWARGPEAGRPADGGGKRWRSLAGGRWPCDSSRVAAALTETGPGDGLPILRFLQRSVARRYSVAGTAQRARVRCAMATFRRVDAGRLVPAVYPASTPPDPAADRARTRAGVPMVTRAADAAACSRTQDGPPGPRITGRSRSRSAWYRRPAASRPSAAAADLARISAARQPALWPLSLAPRTRAAAIRATFGPDWLQRNPDAGSGRCSFVTFSGPLFAEGSMSWGGQSAQQALTLPGGGPQPGAWPANTRPRPDWGGPHSSRVSSFAPGQHGVARRCRDWPCRPSDTPGSAR